MKMKKLFKVKMVLAMCLVLVGLSVATPICAQAADYDISWIGQEDNGAFDGLTETAKQTGNSFYKFLMALGVIGVLCSVVICGIAIVVSQNANKRSERYGQIIAITIGAVLIFGGVGIIGMLKGIGSNVVKKSAAVEEIYMAEIPEAENVNEIL